MKAEKKMETKMHEIPIKEIFRYDKRQKKCQGYIDNDENGVYGMEGKLNIRPEYQREFVYEPKLQNAVIDSIQEEWPLGLLYFVEHKDGALEILDGQQRLISIGQYISGNFSVEGKYFHNLEENQQDQILNYKLLVSFCKGPPSEIIELFQRINTVGKKLSAQEGRNAIYHGPWLSSARRYFSKNGCLAYQIANNLLKGNCIRQDYLETVIKWISGGNIEGYMAKHQHDIDAKPLRKYFEDVIEWVKWIFSNYSPEMKGVPFGPLYNTYKDNKYDLNKIEKEIGNLMQDKDVTKKSGIYSYIFTRDETQLNIRTFDDNDKREVYEQQKGECKLCGDYFEIEDMEADHIDPWSKGGKTTIDNCQMLCLHCNRTKGSK